MGSIPYISTIPSVICIMVALVGITFLEGAAAFIHITSPPKDEAVPAGSPLEISGTSEDNAQTNCRVLVITNNKQPYQEATPAGTGGLNDYSQWSFTISPQYAEIQEGINKITAKASCDALYSPELAQDVFTKEYEKHYSINVTGIQGGNFVSPFIPSEDLGDEAEEEDEDGEDGDSGDDDPIPQGSLFG